MSKTPAQKRDEENLLLAHQYKLALANLGVVFTPPMSDCMHIARAAIEAMEEQ